MSVNVKCTECGVSFVIPRRRQHTKCAGCGQLLLLVNADWSATVSPRPKPTPEQRVIEAARRLAVSQERARTLKSQIQWRECEHYEESEAEVGYPGTAPCPFDGDGEDPSIQERWCEPCRTNWHLRGEWTNERKRRSGLIRGLERAVSALGKSEVSV